MMKRPLLYIVLFCFFAVPARGKIHFNHLGKSDGLSQLSVMSICQDELGRMWFGTLEGLSCYDGEHIVSFKSSEQYPFLGNQVHHVVSDKQGSVIFTNDHNMVHHYDIYTGRFTLLRDSQVSTLYSNDKGIWMATSDSLFLFNRSKMEFGYAYHHPSISDITAVCFDPQERLWVGTLRGLFRINSLEDTHDPVNIRNGRIRALYCDSNHNMWAVGFRSGMFKITDSKIVSYVSDGENTLSSNDVRTLVEDDAGNLWIATFRGLNKLDPQGNFSYYKKDALPGSLKHSSVFSLYRDTQGSIWLGTYFSGVYHFNPRENQLTYYVENAERDDCLSFFFVGKMVEDKRGDVWICTEGGGLNKLDRKTGKFTHYMANVTPHDIPDNNLLSIAYDETSDRLYVGSLSHGLFIMDILSGRIIRDVGIGLTGNAIMNMELHGDKLYLSSHRGCFVMDIDSNGMTRIFSGDHIYNFTVDSMNRLWLSLHDSICRIDLDGMEETVCFNKGEGSLGMFSIPKIIENKGTIYIGTYGFGLYKYEESDGTFQRCGAEGWNYSYYCYDIASSQQGDLVILQENGIVFFNPAQGTVRELNLIDQDINDGCGILICSDGEVFAGSANGMVSLKKENLSSYSPAPYSLFFSSLSVNNQQIYPGDSKIIDKALPFADRVDLRHNQNNIVVDFSSNNYIDRQGNTKYEYRLENLDKEWIAGNESRISYRNLKPGNYTLMVRDRMANGEIGQSIGLEIKVRSPWYASWYAYLLYIILATGTIILFVNNNRARLRLRYSLEKEKREKEKNEEIVQAKLQFFDNISHEFRTPLTLIIGQIEMLLQNENISLFLRNRLMKINNNTFQLRELISELLSFSKINEGNSILNVSKNNFTVFLHGVFQKFQEQASLKNIDYRFHSSADEIECWFDPRQMNKVFQNLLSNAFKFTPGEGKITIEIEDREDDIVVKVSDTGQGIPGEELSKIFDYFYQSGSPASQLQGTGIGLALAKKIVELHHGYIGVTSTLGYGSVFTVILPKEYQFENDSNVSKEVFENQSDVNPQDIPMFRELAEVEYMEQLQFCHEDQEKPSLLIVEDNEEMLQLLIELLSPLYRVSIALNGKEGFEKAMDERPALILSDIAMPEMSGIEMCRKIKNNFDLCHIPVILLTAMASEGTNIRGLQCGADGYLEKPFNSRLLVGRIANTLHNRELLRSKYGQLSEDQPDGTAHEIALTALDRKFLTRLNKLTMDNISNPEFNVNTMAKEIGVSRSSLYNKLKALCNMTPNSYILKIKLRRAAEMMRNNPDLQITEIAYILGFNSLRSFRYSFKAEYNLTPQDYRNQDDN